MEILYFYFYFVDDVNASSKLTALKVDEEEGEIEKKEEINPTRTVYKSDVVFEFSLVLLERMTPSNKNKNIQTLLSIILAIGGGRVCVHLCVCVYLSFL